jgi:alanyl-tRNA synthetase
MMLTTKVRREFIKFFVEKMHKAMPSSSVIPHHDPTLLFINAGMNQFKDYFLGKEEPLSPRIVTSQKCIRVGGKHNDLENVGHTTRHLTFFEMLGNFSFGDYFKKEAIDFAWEVTLNVFKFDIDKLWVSVYHDDDEAFEYWKKHLPSSRIVRIATDDNFWAMGEYGLCGPCTELFYDKGAKFGEGRSPLEDKKGERFFEFWNLVFMQYDRDTKKILHPLPKPCVDTGSGLERVVSLMMGVENIFETDLLFALIEKCEALFDMKYKDQNEARRAAFHVIVDHLRTLSFAIADGVQPSNLDRGYVLRKVLRRAVRYGRQLGAQKPFLSKILPRLVELMHEDYPELKVAQNQITEILELEEEAFIRTLKRGGNLLSSIMKTANDSQNRCISGEDAFKLKDTYGLPFEEIELMAKDHQLSVDRDRYQDLELVAKETSKKAQSKVVQNLAENFYSDFLKKGKRSEFCGYKKYTVNAKVLGIIHEGSWISELQPGQTAEVVLDETPFYAEMGGQVGDSGEFLDGRGLLFQVEDTQSPYTGVIVHKGTLSGGVLKVGQSIEAKVNYQRRHRIEANHTATHLLHWALARVVGEHIKQAGSLVEPQRLRFDFSHHKALSSQDLHKIEDLVNSKIRENRPVENYELAYQEVQRDSSIKQFFGDKYGDLVRVIDMEFSKELCGGTHTSRTGNIGLFKITKESSIAAGVRRIEVATGVEAELFCREQEHLLEALSHSLKTTPTKLSEKLSQLIFEHKNLMEHNKSLQVERNNVMICQLMTKKERVGSYQLIAAELSLPRQELRDFALQLIQKETELICVLSSHEEGNVALVVALSNDLKKEKVSAKEILDAIVEPIEGKGGGKDLFAQAGGSHPKHIPQVFEKARNFISNL